MGFNPDSYTRAHAGLNEATEAVSEIALKHEAAVAVLKDAENQLVVLGTAAPDGWAGLISYINTQVADNPGDQSWLDMKVRSDRLVADFQSLRLAYKAINDAIDAV